MKATDNRPVVLSAVQLSRMTRGIFEAAGSAPREASLIADHLIEANLRGHDSHGVGMIPYYVRNVLAGELKLNQKLSIALDTESLLVAEAGQGVGQAMAYDALNLAIDKANVGGSCLLGLRNSHHIGRIGHWAEQCAEAGLVSIHFVNVVSEPAVAPFGGTAARVGTNPFAVGVPRYDAPPIIIDFATSKWAVGKVRVAFNEGGAVPPGTLLDAFGAPTTDPGVLFNDPKGALLTFGEHKGWGLSLACELLGGALTGGKTQTGPKSREAIINSMFSVLVSPQKLGTLESFSAETSAFLRWAQSEAGASQPIHLSGDPERNMKQRREREGIPIDPVTWQEIRKAGEDVGYSEVL